MSAGIHPVAAPSAPAHEQRQRHGADYGGAVTHREVVETKLRVDPAALAERMHETEPRPTPRQHVRQQRLAEEDAAYEDRRGQYVDIEA